MPQRLLTVALCILLAACASARYPVNPPLPPEGLAIPYDVPDQAAI